MSLRSLSAAAVSALGLAAALVFLSAPDDADQGLIQKIFYLHVPLAIVALGGFVAGGVFAVQYLRTRDRAWDLRSYVSIHLSLIFGVAVLVTGSLWARARGGTGGSGTSRRSFAPDRLPALRLYQPLRFAIEDPERQARYAAVFAVVGGRLRAAELHRGAACPP